MVNFFDDQANLVKTEVIEEDPAEVINLPDTSSADEKEDLNVSNQTLYPPGFSENSPYFLYLL